MLKADLIHSITNLPSATRLFDSIIKIELPNLMSDTEFRDSILKQYQFRKCNFEIVKYEDLPETIKNRYFQSFVTLLGVILIHHISSFVTMLIRFGI